MYLFVLFLHSLIRWVALLAIAGAAGVSLAGWLGGKPWTPQDRRLAVIATASLDTQFLLGIVLYLFLSPTTQSAFADMGVAMKDANLRFWAVEHVTTMVLALILGHVGSVMAKRAAAERRHRWVAITFGLALLLVIAGIPWPFREAVARPWLTLPF